MASKLTLFLALCAIVLGAAVAEQCTPTSSDVLGPYYSPGAPTRSYVCLPTEAQERLIITGRVVSSDCETPLVNAKLDVWQATPEGTYSPGNRRELRPSGDPVADYVCRAVLSTDEQGNFRLVTLMPGRYDDGGYRPAHVHFKVTPQEPGYQPLTTQLYFELDKYLAPRDSCKICKSASPTLIAKVVHRADIKTYEGSWTIVMAKQPRSAFAAVTDASEESDVLPTNHADHDEDDHYTTVRPHIVQHADSDETVQQLTQQLDDAKAQAEYWRAAANVAMQAALRNE